VFLDTARFSSSAILAQFRGADGRGGRPDRLATEPLARAGGAVAPAAAALDGVVTHHVNGFRSGVARFNELLAERLGVPLVGLFDGRLGELRTPLLSFKPSELGPEDVAALERRLAAAGWEPELFLHEFAGSELERRLLAAARRVRCGNAAILERVRKLHPDADLLWTPGLMGEEPRIHPVETSVFSFGMAHKIRADKFRRLRQLLEAHERSYALYVSAANHETTSIRDVHVVFEEMRELFADRLYFMGHLSDLLVQHYLEATTFYAAFFESGVRANNTSVASAMERGAVVVTNLDRHSPPELVHMESVIDIERCDDLPTDPAVLDRIGGRAQEIGRARGWGALVERLLAPRAGGVRERPS
jgi:hypothetical protein